MTDINTRPRRRALANEVEELCNLAAAGLPGMFNGEKNLFCFRVQHSNGCVAQEGISHRYTIMTLLGLHEYAKSGGRVPFDIEAIFLSLTQNPDWITNVGDAGLLLWLAAEGFPQHLEQLDRRLNFLKVLERYPHDRNTMELAWFLAGCSHAAISTSSVLPGTSDIAGAAYRLLIQNQGDSGAFGHNAPQGSLAGRMRAWIGSFADQVYPIYAMSRMAQAYGLDEPVSRALRCADAICGAQGELGQWWWHYDSATGKTLGRYPVYSVHQHGMAPMALFALEQVSSREYSEAICRGLQWIQQANELRSDLRDEAHHLVWRCVRPTPAFLTNLEDVAGICGFAPSPIGQCNLKVLRECRPYESGWLLYALAGRNLRQSQGGSETGIRQASEIATAST